MKITAKTPKTKKQIRKPEDTEKKVVAAPKAEPKVEAKADEKPVIRYTLEGSLPDKTKSPQQLLIAKAMGKLGAATTAEIADAIEKDLVTVQPAERVVSYYLQVWGHKGLVKAIV